MITEQDETIKINLPSIYGLSKSVTDLKKKSSHVILQRTTSLPVANDYANLTRHTGEFHDCIPLPIFDLDLKLTIFDKKNDDQVIKTNQELTKNYCQINENLLGKLILSSTTTAVNHRNNENVEKKINPFVDVVLIPEALQSGYLNFITSVEDVFGETLTQVDNNKNNDQEQKGVIIEEITSLDEESKNDSSDVLLKTKSDQESSLQIDVKKKEE